MKKSKLEVIAEDSSPLIENLWFDRGKLFILLRDGREIGIPLTFYRCLAHANPTDLGMWELGPSRMSIHWPRLDEDLSVEGIIQGIRAPEPDKNTVDSYVPSVLTARIEARLTPESLADRLGLAITTILLAGKAQIRLLPSYVQRVIAACQQ